MADFMEWVSRFDSKEVEGEPHLIVFKEEHDLTEHTYTISISDLGQMFGPVIEAAPDLDNIDKSELKEQSAPHPDEYGEIHKSDWGYERIIDYWEREGYI